jgi:hypothetical protein
MGKLLFGKLCHTNPLESACFVMLCGKFGYYRICQTSLGRRSGSWGFVIHAKQ